jgi:curved DNA-binding protein CbpA
MDQRSPYHILQIRVGATQKEIRKAYRTLAMKYHPDRNPEDPEAEERFKQIQRAYETLSGGDRTRERRQASTSRWEFDAPFSVSRDPFFSFYMAAREHFSEVREKQTSSKKKRERGRKR